MLTRLLLCIAIASTALMTVAPSPTNAARAKIGGGGPYDRATFHFSEWCFNEWPQANCGTGVETFVADGADAVVRFTVRNYWQGSPMGFVLDRFAVVTKAAYDANLIDGSAAESNCTLLVPTVNLLDLASIAPADVVYSTDFDTSLGAEWTVDGTQVSWTPSGAPDDPFNTGSGSTTGAMLIGTGSGPEFLTVEIVVAGLTSGVEYALSHWTASAPREFFTEPDNNCNGGLADDEWEVEIFGADATDAPSVNAAARLNQNFPNPFNPRTSIPFFLNQPGNVTLTVFDARGREVRTLVDSSLDVGSHERFWDGRDAENRNAPAGLYYYRLTTAEGSLTKPMILLK